MTEKGNKTPVSKALKDLKSVEDIKKWALEKGQIDEKEVNQHLTDIDMPSEETDELFDFFMDEGLISSESEDIAAKEVVIDDEPVVDSEEITESIQKEIEDDNIKSSSEYNKTKILHVKFVMRLCKKA